jgi:NADPH-dependent 2,4-dienoyl-CoA reductase/sulfur reductase-like enzyme
VNQGLRTSHPDIYAAGDVASFPSLALGKRVRVEHEDNANSMGRTAGRNMAGADETYRHVPFFYSDLFDMGYEAVGDIDSRLATVADWQEPYREGVVHYLRDGARSWSAPLERLGQGGGGPAADHRSGTIPPAGPPRPPTAMKGKGP